MLKFPKALVLALALNGPACADQLGLGRTALPDEIAAWDTDIRPDGLGLPVGQGDAITGEELFAEACADCHGDFGEADDQWPALAGGHDTLNDPRPIKTIGSYWPYLSTVWDYVHRAMPYGDAASLSVDETYAIVAFLLYVNDITDDDSFVLSNENFLTIRMPNAHGFHNDDRLKTEFPVFTDTCMTNCKGTVEITKNVAVPDLNP